MKMNWADGECKYGDWIITRTGTRLYPYTFVHKDFRGTRETAHLQGFANTFEQAVQKIDSFDFNLGTGDVEFWHE